MALSDLVVFQEQVKDAMTEVLTQQVDLFNSASQGTITLNSSAHMGDYNERSFFAKISGLVRRRNAYGSGAVASKKLTQLLDTMVKVAAGTAPVELDEGQFRWIQTAPQVAGAAVGQQIAKDALGDMLNTGLIAAQAAFSAQAAINFDNTLESVKTLTLAALIKGAAKFGDRSSELAAWVMHSTPMHGLYLNNVTNLEKLFEYGTVNVVRDPFGRVFIMTDSPALINATPTPDLFYVLGLTPNSITVDQNNDFDDNIQKINGSENILKTYQAEWSYNLGIKGYTWNKTAGGHSPNDAAIGVATNWPKIVTDNKDLAGVMITCN